MNIFIAWSGPTALKIATELKTLIELLFGGVTCFLSSEDIEKGTDWFSKIKSELNTSNFGIFCITNENKESPWLNFEAGAMANHTEYERARVATLLIGDMTLSDLSETPLSKFQSTILSKDSDFFRLIKDINKLLASDEKTKNLIRSESILDTLLESHFQDFKEKVGKILSGASKSKPQKTPERRDILKVLDRVLGLEQSLSSFKDDIEFSMKIILANTNNMRMLGPGRYRNALTNPQEPRRGSVNEARGLFGHGDSGDEPEVDRNLAARFLRQSGSIDEPEDDSE